MRLPFYRVLWIIIHLIADLIEAAYNFGIEFRENFANFIKNITQARRFHVLTDDRKLIESHSSEIKTIPKHLAVILNANSEDDVDLKQLTNLVVWSLSSNINFISFYDYQGIVKHQLSSSFYKTIKQLVSIDDSENIVWGPDYQTPADGGIKFPHRNGYKRHIVVNLYSSDDGHAKFDHLLTQELCREDMPIESRLITIDFIDDKLKKIFGHLPDPDLALYFGSHCCTMGFMPWHIRLTEFIPISSKLQNLSLNKFLRVLYKYAKCEKRFGK